MDYTTAELLKWLGEQSRLLGWDMIFFIDGGKINSVLRQESIRRFNTENNFPPISGYIPNGAGRRFALFKCSLYLPRMTFDVNLAGSKAHLHMAIAQANAYALAKQGNHWNVRQLDVIGPLQSAVLSLDIDLAESVGSVDECDTIKLDLSNTENFSLPCYTGETRPLTDFFRQKFSALTDAQRQYPIGKLADTGSGVFRPESFALRTQARGRNGNDVEGAIVILSQLNAGAGGNFPGADYKYGIPKDGDYSASVLFDSGRLVLDYVADMFKGFIEEAEFEFFRSDSEEGDGYEIGFHCKAGKVKVPEQDFVLNIPIYAACRTWPPAAASG